MVRKRVVLLGKYFPPEPGGMELVVHEIAEALKDAFDVHVLVHARGRQSVREDWDGYRVIRCGTWAEALSQPFSPSMIVELARLKPDIVQFNAPNAFGNLVLTAAGRRAKTIVTHHADVEGRPLAKRLYTPLYARVVARADAVVVLSRKNARISADLPACEDKLVEIPQGLDPALWHVDAGLQSESDAFRATLAPAGATLAVFVGRLVPYKGLDVLLDALVGLDDVHVALAGSGPSQAALEARARALGLEHRVRFLGGIDEATKKRLLLAGDMFVLPSTTPAEAFGISQVEAQMLGRPVVATNLPTGVTDVTVDGVTGLLARPGDAVTLAGAIARLAGDPDLRERLGAAGQARAMERFTLQAFRAAYLALFERIASAP